jgi:hypothetical protein
MHITITIAGADIAGRLPLIPARFRVVRAHAAANGLIYDESTDDWRRDDAGAILTDFDPDVAGCVYAACVGMCWAAEEPPPPVARPLRSFSHEVVEYGEAVMAELYARGVDLHEITTAGERVYQLIAESIPNRRELEEAVNPIEAPVETSTGATSAPA